MEALLKVHTQISVWERSVRKVVAQLSSILNLLEQLEALKRGKTGVLIQHGGHVTSLLSMKLVRSMERALMLAIAEK